MLSPPQEDRELIADLKEGLFLMTEAYKAVLGTSDEEMLEELLLKYINKSDSTACCVALRYFTYYVVLGSIQGGGGGAKWIFVDIWIMSSTFFVNYPLTIIYKYLHLSTKNV